MSYGEPNPLIGKTIVAVYLAQDKGAIKFELSDGTNRIARADGDCCSHSWVESLDTPGCLLGTVVSVEDIDMPEHPYDTNEHECLQFYGCRVTTDKGICVIDYRNSSNGYYGGSLEWGEYFYGGVFGQNVSKNEWRKVA